MEVPPKPKREFLATAAAVLMPRLLASRRAQITDEIGLHSMHHRKPLFHPGILAVREKPIVV
jgi:hypothetical protein